MKKKSPKLIITLVLVLLLVATGAAFLFFNSNYAVLDGKVYPISVTEIDLRNSEIKNLAPLNKLRKLERADISGSKVQTLDPLKGCPSLRAVIISGSDFAADQCIDFYQLHPDAELVCGVIISDRTYSSDTRAAEVSETADDDEIKQFAALKKLETLDLTKVNVSDGIIDYLQLKLPDCAIARKLTFNGTEYLSTDETVTLPADFFDGNVPAGINILKRFNNLKTIDATACKGDEALYDLQQLFPDCCVKWNISIFNQKTNTAVESLNFDKQERTLEEYKAEFEKKLKYFHNLKRISMCKCGLSDDSMGTLIEQYPGIKFVWYVSVGRWLVRSDATSFSTLIWDKADGRRWNENNCASLFKYCTDLVSLDMGHCHMKDISAITNLKKLRGLILTDNFVEDISPLAELEYLEFVEMNGNNVKSVEPLKDLKNLKMLNLTSSADLIDLSPLYEHDNLKMVIFDSLTPKDEQERFTKSNPNCKSYFIKGRNTRTTNNAWKAQAMREKYKNSFRYWNFVVGYDEEKDEFLYDYSNRFRMGYR